MNQLSALRSLAGDVRGFGTGSMAVQQAMDIQNTLRNTTVDGLKAYAEIALSGLRVRESLKDQQEEAARAILDRTVTEL